MSFFYNSHNLLIINFGHLSKKLFIKYQSMKKYLIITLILFSANLNSQSIIQRVGNRVKEKVEQKIENKADEATDIIIDKTENSVKKGAKKNNEISSTDIPVQNSEIQQKSQLSYSKYDFVPGAEVIFEDDLKNEQKGEFPSRWDLIEGSAEIAQIDGENVIAFVGYTYITPLFKEKTFLLPDEFTLEFDLFLDGNEGESAVEFLNANGDVIANSLFWKDNQRFLFNWNLTSEERSAEDTFDNFPGWHHYALSFNKRAFKVYMDAKRVANIPNVTERPVKLRLFARGEEDKSSFHIKNIRLAKGAVPLYDKLMTNGRIITYGITFDTGKSTIKPHSMGVINEIFAMMQKYPELKFSVEGHTDNTGNASLNQTLSESRAKAVCEKLVEMGISSDRLSSKGYGMSNPIDSNQTSEGRAKNRRVEFVKR